MKYNYLLVGSALMSLINFASPANALSSHSESGTTKPSSANGTFIVMLKNHADRAKAKKDILEEAQGTTVKDIHFDKEDYSILHVSGATAAKLTAMMKSHSEIKGIYADTIWTSMKKPVSGPNDPEYSQQWPLSQMRWAAAQSTYAASQQNPARITILSSGTTPVTTGNELGAYVTQYNATGSTITQEAVKGYDAEGDVDSSISGCLTNNSVDIAGAANFAVTKPTYITMLRITSGGSVSTSTILNALAWAANNQTARGGAGPINLSYGTSYPSAPLWSSPSIQNVAATLLNQGDILVVAAGDTKGTYSTQYPPGNVVVVQGTNKKGAFYPPLTKVQGDPVAAPGAVQPAVISGKYSDAYYGTSFSAPLWCSAIATVMSVNPSLTSLQAHNIVLKSGTAVTGSSYAAVVPAFDKAIQAALSQ